MRKITLFILFILCLHIPPAKAADIEVTDYGFSDVELKNGGTVAFNVTVKNNTSGSKNVCAVMTLFKNGVVQSVSIGKESMEASAVKTVTTRITVADKENSSISVFLWDGLNHMQPIYNKIPFSTLTDLTTTVYAPHMRQLNMTCAEEAGSNIKGGEAGQMVFGLCISPGNTRNMLLGTDTSGIWRSSDGGATWLISSYNFKLPGVVDMAYYPADCNIAFAAASPNNSGNPKLESANAGIWKSTDGGISWRQTLSTSFYRNFTNKIIKFGELDQYGNRTIYAGSHTKGIFKSTDKGETWTNIGRVGDTITDLSLTGNKIIAVSTESGVAVSSDAGATWQTQNNGFAGTKVSSLAVNPNDSQMWFAVENGVLYKSTNAGSSWTSVSVPAAYMTSSSKITKVNFGAYNPQGNPTLYLSIQASTYSLRYSTNLGASWNLSQPLNANAYIKTNNGWMAEALAVHPTEPGTVFAPFDNSLYKSTDGGATFTPSGSGFSGFRASDFLFDANDPDNIYIALVDRGISKSVPGFASPYPLFVNLTDDGSNNIRYDGEKTVHGIARDPQNPQHLIANVGNWGSSVILKQSFNGGASWSSTTGTEDKTGKVICYHPQNSSIIYAGKNYSGNEGASWTTLAKSVAAVSPLDGDVVWAIEGNDIYKSTNRGQSWTSLGVTIYGMQRITADYARGDTLWVGTFSSSLYKVVGNVASKIGTESGIMKNSNDMIGIYDIAQNPNNPDHLIAGGCDQVGFAPSAGIFESKDGGVTWKTVLGMPGMRDIWRIEFHPARPHVYIATSSGTWIYDYSIPR